MYMKLFIYIILFALLIVYVNKKPTCSENLSNSSFTTQEYDTPDPYNVLKTDLVKPILIDNRYSLVTEYNSNDDNIYSNKPWILKKGFSDIYNYEDIGGEIIRDIANGFDVIKQKKVPDQIKPDTVVQEKLPLVYEYENNSYKMLGIADNPYFNQYYYIYENEVKQKNSEPLLEEDLEYLKNNRIYQYLLVRLNKGQPIVNHWISPRNKIEIGDVIYFALATFQLGPLSIKDLK